MANNQNNPIPSVQQPSGPTLGQNASGGQQPNTFKADKIAGPTPKGPTSVFGSRLFMIGGIGLMIFVLVVGVVLVFPRPGEKSATSTGELTDKTNPDVILPSANPNPPPLAPISDFEYRAQATTLSAYFKQVSPVNFKEEFMASVPAVTSTAYDQYLGAGDEAAKLESARNFYDYLSGSSVKSDPEFIKFLEDVKSDLEKTLGKPLF